MNAIILSRRDFREHDQIISLYTKEFGKLALLARGVKKITSKQSAHLEPFSIADISIVKGKELDHLTTAQSIALFSGIRSNMHKSILAGYAAHAFDDLTHRDAPDPRLYDLLSSWLLHLDATPAARALLLDALIFRLFALLGFVPVLDCSALSGAPYRGGDRWKFLPDAGGLVKDKESSEGTPILPADVVFLNDVLYQSFETLLNSTIDKESYRRGHAFVYSFVVFHSERPMDDWAYFLAG